MTYATTRPEEITALVGEIDPDIVQRIIDTGASIDEIAEALSELEEELGAEEQHLLAPSPQVAEVRALLEPLFEDGGAENVVRGSD